jgi:hypothetical protein
MNSYEDIEITCRDCGGIFTFTAGQQVYFASKQLQQPRRCEPCRRERRAGANAVAAIRHLGNE